MDFWPMNWNLHNQADISAAQLKKLAAHIGASFSHELCGHRNPSYLFTRRKVISFFNFSFFYFFSCIFAEIDFLLSSCRASISESDNRPSGTYGDSGDLSPLTFDKKSQSSRLSHHLGISPSDIYSESIQPLCVLHSRFPTKKLWVVAYFWPKKNASQKFSNFFGFYVM